MIITKKEFALRFYACQPALSYVFFVVCGSVRAARRAKGAPAM